MKKLKKLISTVLCAVMLLTVLPVPALAEEVKIEQADDHTVISSRYAFQPRYISGKTSIETFGFVTDEKDVWSDNATGGDYSTVEMVAIKDESQKGNVGVWYRNVGQYQGNTIDLKITVSDWKEIRTVNTSINGKPNYPSVEFWKDRILIGISTDSFHDIAFEYEFFNAEDGLPADITGHLTFADVDASEQLTLNGSTFDKAYTSTNSVLSIQGNSVSCAADISTNNNDTSTWCTVLFSTPELEFSYNRTVDDINASTSRRYFSMLTTNAVSIPFGTPLIVKAVSKEIITTEDTYDYLLYMNTPAQPSGKEYTSFVLTDTLDSNITLADNSFTAKTDSGADISQYFSLDFRNQDIKITADESFVKSSAFCNQQFIFSFRVKVKEEHNFDISGGKAVIYNKSMAQTNYGTETSNTVQTEVRFNLYTQITNGSITESESNIPGGTNRTVTFTPNHDCYVSSVTVDGQAVDTEQYKEGGSYTFNGIKDNHSVEVICSPYKYHSINIKYLDENNNPLAEEFNQELREGLNYDVSKTANKDIPYYTLVSVDGMTSGTMNEDIHIIVRYKRNKNTLTIHYLDAETREAIAEPYSAEYAQGVPYDVQTYADKDIAYYSYWNIEGESIGTIHEDVVIYVLYARNQNTVTINYFDEETGEPLADSMQKTFPQGSDYDVASDTAKEFEHYTQTRIDGDTSGVIEDSIIIDVYYKKNKGNVTVNYLDDKGKCLAASETFTDYVTKEYQTEEKSFDGYALTAVPDNASGIFLEEDVIVDYIYTLKDGIVTVAYVDEEGSKLCDDIVIPGKVFEEYTTSAKEFQGYSLKSTPKNAQGEILEEPTTVTYIYSKDMIVPIKEIKEKKSPDTGNHDTAYSIHAIDFGFYAVMFVLIFTAMLLCIADHYWSKRKDENE